MLDKYSDTVDLKHRRWLVYEPCFRSRVQLYTRAYYFKSAAFDIWAYLDAITISLEACRHKQTLVQPHFPCVPQTIPSTRPPSDQVPFYKLQVKLIRPLSYTCPQSIGKDMAASISFSFKGPSITPPLPSRVDPIMARCKGGVRFIRRFTTTPPSSVL